MSIVKIRSALETALNNISPVLDTAWENTQFEPQTGTAYQRAYLIFTEPNNQEYGSNYQELGFLQVDLIYPLLSGPSASDVRFELIRDAFKRGTSFVYSGVTVTINRTPYISPAYVSGDRFIRPVKIRFYANIGV
jgi:hypothetical protein